MSPGSDGDRGAPDRFWHHQRIGWFQFAPSQAGATGALAAPVSSSPPSATRGADGAAGSLHLVSCLALPVELAPRP